MTEVIVALLFLALHLYIQNSHNNALYGGMLTAPDRFIEYRFRMLPILLEYTSGRRYRRRTKRSSVLASDNIFCHPLASADFTSPSRALVLPSPHRGYFSAAPGLQIYGAYQR